MKMKSELENLNVNVTLSAVSCEVTLSAVSYGACYFPFGSLIGLGKWSLKLLIFFPCKLSLYYSKKLCFKYFCLENASLA